MRNHGAPSYLYKTKLLDARLRKIGGQLSGIRTMLNEQRDCLDIVQQIEAVSSASREVAILLLETHLRALVRDGAEKGNDAVMDELAHTLRRIMKAARG